MKLSEWIRQSEQTQSAVSRKLGISRSFMTRLVKEERRPGPAVAQRIEMLTGGNVRKSDLRPDIWGES